MPYLKREVADNNTYNLKYQQEIISDTSNEKKQVLDCYDNMNACIEDS